MSTITPATRKHHSYQQGNSHEKLNNQIDVCFERCVGSEKSAHVTVTQSPFSGDVLCSLGSVARRFCNNSLRFAIAEFIKVIQKEVREDLPKTLKAYERR